jgi:hypothetical protein
MCPESPLGKGDFGHCAKMAQYTVLALQCGDFGHRISIRMLRATIYKIFRIKIEVGLPYLGILDANYNGIAMATDIKRI